jgi:hypothetical protein
MCNTCAAKPKSPSKNTLLSIYLSNTRYVFALDEIIKRAFDIIETSDDNREKLQAMELFKDTHLVKLELLSNATTIDSALNYIRRKQQQEELDLDPNTVDNKDDDQPSHKHTVF